MADQSKIEWTDATWNPVTGCSVVSAGCRHCYAMKLAGTRLQHHPSRSGLTRETSAGPVWTGEVRFNEEWLVQPIAWKRRRRIFVCAHGDLFHEDIPDEWIDRVFSVMALAPQHTFQVLTKRSKRMRAYMTAGGRLSDVLEIVRNSEMGYWAGADKLPPQSWPLPNVWIGVSVENQATADERIPLLLQTPAAVRWISAEPLLGDIRLGSSLQLSPSAAFVAGKVTATMPDWTRIGSTAIDWVVAGGESGPKARPMHPDWARTLRDQCAVDRVPFLFKQWGEWSPEDAGETQHSDTVGILPSGDCAYYSTGYVAPFDTQDRLEAAGGVRLDGRTLMDRVGKKAAGRLLDGKLHDGYPEARP